MPPRQCPSCGRFLKNAFVAGLDDAPAPCPGCGEELTAARVAGTAGDGQAAGAAASEPAESIRPPDVAPETVRDDVLEGWDLGVPPDELGGHHLDRPPPPIDAMLVAGAALAGAGLGLLLGRRRVRGALLGAVVGALAAGAARQVWRLEA